MSTDPTCPVCADTIGPDVFKVQLLCGHTFHTHCIVDWFRTGQRTCPMCRDKDERLRHLTPGERISRMRRKTTLPKQLKQLIQSMDEAKAKLADMRKKRIEFRRAHEHVMKEYERMNRMQNMYNRKFKALRHQIANTPLSVAFLLRE